MLTGMPVPPIDVDLVVRAAWLYYEDGLTQAQVAARLFVSRQTVGRLLESARQHGIVRIELDPAYLAAMRLATTVRDVFGLRDAIVVPTATGRLSQERTNERVAAALAAYAEQTLEKVSHAMRDLPSEKWTRVYVALEADGLASVCRKSQRAEVFAAAGALSVHDCPPGTEEAFLRVTFEQLMAYNPEVILVFHPALMRRIPTDPKWSSLPAVRQGKVYFIPRGPFSWLERPATYMRLLGVQWLANKLHPDLYPVDIAAESRANLAVKLSPSFFSAEEEASAA